MELIPIIKYALTMISGIAFIVVLFSYIMYKIKNSDKAPVENNTQVINTFEPQSVPAYNQNMVLQPVYSQREAVYAQERSYQNNRVARKKPVQRFMVLNSQTEQNNSEVIPQLRDDSFSYENSFSRKGFNIYSNYSVNTAEPMHKFGV